MKSDTRTSPGEQVELLPHFRQTERSPRLPETPGGILLAAEPPRASSAGPFWVLRGSFRIADAGVADESVLGKIVLALTSGASHVTLARHAVGETVIFPEDVIVSQTEIAGYFNVNLPDLFEFTNRREAFHIVASIGAHTSEVLTCEVEFPWVDWPVASPPETADLEAEEEGEEDEAGDDDSWMVDEDPEQVR